MSKTMTKEAYLDHFRANRDAILEAAPKNLDAAVKGCPGWDVGALVGHMGGVHTFWLRWVTQRPEGPTPDIREQFRTERERLLPGFSAWSDAGFSRELRPEGVLAFARSTGDDLQAELEALSPEDHVWTFVPSRQNASFVFRRIAQETGVHRWDAENAVGIDRPIEPDLARDGIDEMLFALPEIASMGREGANGRTGQRVRLVEAGSGDNTWLVSFEPDRMREIEDDGRQVDLEVRGAASDLLLFVVGRLTPDEIEMTGDRALAGQWADLAGRF